MSFLDMKLKQTYKEIVANCPPGYELDSIVPVEEKDGKYYVSVGYKKIAGMVFCKTCHMPVDIYGFPLCWRCHMREIELSVKRFERKRQKRLLNMRKSFDGTEARERKEARLKRRGRRKRN